ncbi:hypothetical protein OKW50_001774 [Paraburkholderia youngii]
MTAAADHLDDHRIRRRHERPRHEAQLGRRKARHVVHREHGVAGKPLEQAVVEHFLRAGEPFLGRLEDQIERAVETLFMRQIPGGGEQHRRVAVVTACVHLAGPRARVWQAGGFVDWQRVHVGAQAEPARAVAELQLTDHARLPQAAMHGIAPLPQAFGDQITGRELLVGELRMRVDAVSQRDHFLFDFGDARRNDHRVHAVCLHVSVNRA